MESPRHRGHRIVLEDAGRNWSAYAPDLPGCVATGPTAAAAEREMRRAIDEHLDGLPVTRRRRPAA